MPGMKGPGNEGRLVSRAVHLGYGNGREIRAHRERIGRDRTSQRGIVESQRPSSAARLIRFLCAVILGVPLHGPLEFRFLPNEISSAGSWDLTVNDYSHRCGVSHGVPRPPPQ